MRLLAAALCTSLVFAASPLVWLATDSRHHALNAPDDVAQGQERFVEHTPLMYVNRNDWLGGWLATHRPPQALYLAHDPEFNARRYLGIVALAIGATGWLAARRRCSLRRWYQVFGLVFVLQYWMAIGPRTLVWQLGRSFAWPESADGPVRAALALAAAACIAWALRSRLRVLRSPDDRALLGAELAVGLAVVAVVASFSLFAVLRAFVPGLAGMRSPGHFFDLAPFAFYGWFGVGLVALGRTIGSAAGRHALIAAVAALLALDFWPSVGAFRRGTALAPVREFEQVLSQLPGEGGSLRVMLPWYSPSGWTVPSLMLLRSEAGAAWSWLGWQSGRHWRTYGRGVALPFVRAIQPAMREEARPVSEALSRIGRLKYLLEEVEVPSRLEMAEPWTRRAANGRFVLWERPDVLPFASGYRAYVVAVGRADDAATVSWALARDMPVVSADRPLPAALTAGAALVIDRAPGAGDDARLAGARRETFTVTHARPAPERIVLEADAGEAPALVFVSEGHHPWWRATVDGRDAPLLRAQLAFMAVAVGPGRHVVELNFRPPLVVVLADVATAGAWCVLPLALAGWAVGRRRRGS